MNKTTHKSIAIVGVGAVMPDATDLPAFWNNIKSGVYSISETPPDRWDINVYYDSDHKVPDKTYSKIGGWVKKDNWNPLQWKLPIPPMVDAQLDFTQRWAIMAAREALMDFGYPDKKFDTERTAVILGVAMGGDQHLYSAARILFPEYVKALNKTSDFSSLHPDLRKKIIAEAQSNLKDLHLDISEDTMPGELSNIVAGRIAALFNFRGPNFIADAACASAMAGITAAIAGLEANDYDLVVTGGIDANMSASTYVKFSKIGALSATGTRPYAEGADGFVMGEGAAVFILKRLEEAERDGDKIYAVIRGMGGSSDGKGKGITAPNPIGQILAVKRAWENSGVSPATVSMIEGHGTSTSVGDAAELESLQTVFGGFNLPIGSVALGSVKSNIGHLKGAAGAAGIMKATMALHEKVLPPSLNFHQPNPGFDFSKSPFAVNTQLRAWETKNGTPRRCGVSAFGFGGTNFHIVLEEYIPGKIVSEERTQVSMAVSPASGQVSASPKLPLRGVFVKGAPSVEALAAFLEGIVPKVQAGWTPEIALPSRADLDAPFRIAIDFENAEDLAGKIGKAAKALRAGNPGMWKPLNAKGVYFGQGSKSKTAFLFTGQGSQYINMLRELREVEPIVAETFREADEVMTPVLGKPLTEYIFFDKIDEEAIQAAEKNLMQTEITQPSVLAVDIALHRLMCAYGMKPDFVIGHSLGEYGALVAAGAISFADALKSVSARGAEMAKVGAEDKGILAAVFASPAQIQEVIDKIDGYVVIANINSYGQSVIGGETIPVQNAMKACAAAGYHVAQLPVSHAFHTKIVAPASPPLSKVLEKFGLKAPSIPTIANVTGDFYPTGPDTTPEMIDLLSRQVASPVQFVKGINKLYDSGVRLFIEMGPKKALNGFVRDMMEDKADVANLFTNHPKVGDVASFNQALCGMYAAGLGAAAEEKPAAQPEAVPAPVSVMPDVSNPTAQNPKILKSQNPDYAQLGRLFVDFMDKANAVYSGGQARGAMREVWITGAAVGLPKVNGVFQDTNVEQLLNGEQFITSIPTKFQHAMLDKNITRLVKMGKGGPRFETITEIEEVIKLAGQKNNLDIVRDFGFPQSRKAAIDTATELAIGAGLDAMRDAGIPLVMHYRTTTTGSKLPERWLLPEQFREDTGIIFASAFPGYNAYAREMREFFENKALQERLAMLESIRNAVAYQNGNGQLLAELDTRINEAKNELEKTPYHFNRRFLLRVLGMGHSQFAEYIGARGPNTHINAACASTTQAIGLAKDWIEAGRCRRVIVIAADDITGEDTIDWFSSGFLAVGAAATDEKIEEAALPFDKRRHGMIVGMGGAAIVVEDADSARDRGLNPICEVLATAIANSAYHGTRLDVNHIKVVMENLVLEAEQRWGIDRFEIAAQTVFVSHETYTPARGGSAAAEINALRHVFKSEADKIVIANTKGMTGHPMAVGIEDVLAVKSLETGLVPPVPNFKEVDPELGLLNLSKGGAYPIRYALRLAAGFGSQISMTLLRWTPTTVAQTRPKPGQLGYTYRIADQALWKNWLREISGKENPEMEVVKRTLRIFDPMGEMRNDVEEVPVAETVPAPSVTTTPSEIPQAPVQAPLVVASVSTPLVADTNGVKEKVLALIAEKTGYPVDMLDPSLDLEADLGIDTVKQAELFAEIRGAYGIERDENLQLSEFPTLNHIIQFVFDKRPDLVTAPLVAATPVVTAQAQAPTPSVAAAPVSAPSVASTNGTSGVKEKVLALIAEKTGYPVDMLDPSLDLEADLGIDTVKQAELFAEIRGAYGIERDENLQLSEFPTLNHIIQFVFDKRPDLVTAAATPVETAQAQAPTPSVTAVPVSAPSVAGTNGASGVKEKVLALIAEKTGYPVEMLDPNLDLEADLGIDTVKQAELFAEIRGAYGIERDENLQLSEFPTLNHIIQFVFDKRPDLVTAPSVAATPVETAQAQSPTTLVAVPVSAPSVAATNGTPGVKEKVLTLIAEKTGYPVEMLDPNLDLEADLGIDTVKQAELFAEIRGAYGIERDENLQLSEFPTLNHIIQFVFDKRPDLVTAPSVAAAPPVETSQSPAPLVAAPESAPSVADTNGTSGVKEKVLALIAEKTGYPVDMLDPDLDLEADLGIDTVKQAELFAEIRGMYGIERDENLQLSEFPTINHIIQFVFDKRPVSSTLKVDAVAATFKVDAMIPRRIPTPQLRPDLSFCKPSGVTLKGSVILLMSDEGGVGKALVSQLEKAGATVHLLNAFLSPETLQAQIADWLKEGPVEGVFWLPALDFEGEISSLSYDEWKAATHLRVKLLYTTMRELVMLQKAGPFLISATRMGGHFGYDEQGALAPLGGAVCGFTKAYKREHPITQVKVVDFERSRKTTAFAERLIEEALKDPGVVEVGYKNDLRWTIGLEEKPQPEGESGMKLGKDSTFLVTGAAGSITSAITADLAEASGGTFYLLDLTPTPDPNDADLQHFAHDREGLKQAIFTRMKAAGEKVTPVIVDKELAGIERRYSALAAIQAVEKAGGTAHYFSVNLLDNRAVAKVVEAIKQQSEKIDVLLHAGGLEISRLLPDKSPQEFNLVFDVKADGWYNLLSTLGDFPIGTTVAFSSIAGRFGNGGQTDYSSANDFLCKCASSFRSFRPSTRGIALDWTAWKEIGMASRGSIPTVMKQAGIDMLPPEAGIPFIRRELTAGITETEIVVAQNLGMMMNEFDPDGGLDNADNSALTERVRQANGVMVQEISGIGLYSGLVVKATFDPKEQGFLFDHEINGTPVLPGVMGVEAMVEAAKILFPNLHVKSVEAVDFMSPFKFYRSEPREIHVKVQFNFDQGDVIAHCELYGSRIMLDREEVKTHFRANVRLTDKAPDAPKPDTRNLKPAAKQAIAGAADIYRIYFHGPAYQVIEKTWKKKDNMIGLFAENLPANHHPAGLQAMAMPRLIELCFQTAGIWEMGTMTRMGLPAHIDQLQLYKQAVEGTRLYAVVSEADGAYDASIVDDKGAVYLGVKGYTTVEFMADFDEKLLEPLKAVTV